MQVAAPGLNVGPPRLYMSPSEGWTSNTPHICHNPQHKQCFFLVVFLEDCLELSMQGQKRFGFWHMMDSECFSSLLANEVTCGGELLWNPRGVKYLELVGLWSSSRKGFGLQINLLGHLVFYGRSILDRQETNIMRSNSSFGGNPLL